MLFVCHKTVSMVAVYQLKIKYDQDKFVAVFSRPIRHDKDAVSVRQLGRSSSSVAR